MKISFPMMVAASTLIFSPVAAIAQHVDVGPGGVAVQGDRHGGGHREGGGDHHERKVEHRDSHHGDRHNETVVVKERHGGDRH